MGSDTIRDPERSLTDIGADIRIAKDATPCRFRASAPEKPVRLRAEIVASVQAADFVEAADAEMRISAAFRELKEVYKNAELRIYQKRAPRRTVSVKRPAIIYDDD